MAKGEKELGRYKKESNFAIINVGYGVATGLEVNDLLLHGNQRFTGEIGHIQIQPNSEINSECGKYSCLEALATGRRIAQMDKGRLSLKIFISSKDQLI